MDVSGCKNAYEAYIKVNGNVKFSKCDLYRVNLIGEVDFDVDRLAADVEKMLADACYFISIKDKTTRKIDIAKYENDLSIRGEFIRTVYADKKLSDDEKITIINCGLRALDGKEIDL